MKRTITIFLATLGLVAVPAGADDWSGWTETLAGFSYETTSGDSQSLADLRGQIVVVNFWASWCKPCKKELKHLDEWNALLDDEAVELVAVSVDRDVRKMARFVESEDITLSIVHDGPDGLAKTLGLPSLPCTVVLDREGRVVRVVTDGKLESLREALPPVLARKAG